MLSDKDTELRELFASGEVTSWRSVVMAYRMIFSLLDSRLQKLGFSVPRIQVMVALYFDGPTVPVTLARRLMVTRGNISTLLKRMQKEGLIEPTTLKGTEKRPAFVLTPRGITQFREIYPLHAANIKELMPELDAQGLQKFGTIQEKIYRKYRIGVPLTSRRAHQLSVETRQASPANSPPQRDQ